MIQILALLVWASPASSLAPEVETHGEVRIRGEVYDEADLDDESDDLTLDGERILLRTRLSFEASPEEHVTVFIQAQDSRIFGSEPTTTADTEGLDLYQGYVDLERVAGQRLDLRAGRMELSYGDQRLLGAFGWSNAGRAFDALRVRGTVTPKLRVDAFYARLHHDRSDIDRVLGDDLACVYAMYETTSIAADLYVLYLHDEGGSNGATFRFQGDGGMHMVTAGARFDGEVAPALRLNAEAVGQAGSRGDLGIVAYAAHADLAYAIAAPATPTLHAGYDIASGDSDPTDDTFGTFENLFPTNHLFYGYLDLSAWKNISNPHGGVSATPTEETSLALKVHRLMRLEREDTFYRASGAPLRGAAAANAAGSRGVGTEIDLLATWAVSRHVSLLGGLSYLVAGAFLDDTDPEGEAPDSIFGYLQLAGRF